MTLTRYDGLNTLPSLFLQEFVNLKVTQLLIGKTISLANQRLCFLQNASKKTGGEGKERSRNGWKV